MAYTLNRIKCNMLAVMLASQWHLIEAFILMIVNIVPCLSDFYVASLTFQLNLVEQIRQTLMIRGYGCGG